jgi:hypothetical protein
MIGVLGEQSSDCEFIEVMIKRISRQSKMRFAKKSFDGCGNLLREGAKHLKNLAAAGVSQFIVCIDADGKEVSERQAEVRTRIFDAASFKQEECNAAIVVPVQEIESWILANASAFNKPFPTWNLKDHKKPESIQDPKRVLEKSTQMHNGRPRYSPKTHNRVAAEHLDIGKLCEVCPSFKNFHAFVEKCV